MSENFEDKFEFSDDLFIDLNRLEWETARQAKLFGKWGKRWAIATKNRDRALERVKTKRSELLLEVQGTWKELGFPREPTAPQAEAYYRSDEEYKQLKQDSIMLNYEVNMLYVSMRAFEHKRNMIGIEQKLYSDEYWSTPYEDKGFVGKVQDDMETAQLEALDKASDRLGQKTIKKV